MTSLLKLARRLLSLLLLHRALSFLLQHMPRPHPPLSLAQHLSRERLVQMRQALHASAKLPQLSRRVSQPRRTKNLAAASPSQTIFVLVANEKHLAIFGTCSSLLIAIFIEKQTYLQDLLLQIRQLEYECAVKFSFDTLFLITDTLAVVCDQGPVATSETTT
jgi:hypothetical protein